MITPDQERIAEAEAIIRAQAREMTGLPGSSPETSRCTESRRLIAAYEKEHGAALGGDAPDTRYVRDGDVAVSGDARA